MKAFLILVAVLLVGLLVYNYFTTGVISILPQSLSPAERELRDLKEELTRVRQEEASLSRQIQASSAMGGEALAVELENLLKRKTALEQRIAETEAKIARQKGG